MAVTCPTTATKIPWARVGWGRENTAVHLVGCMSSVATVRYRY